MKWAVGGIDGGVLSPTYFCDEMDELSYDDHAPFTPLAFYSAGSGGGRGVPSMATEGGSSQRWVAMTTVGFGPELRVSSDGGLTWTTPAAISSVLSDGGVIFFQTKVIFGGRFELYYSTNFVATLVQCSTTNFRRRGTSGGFPVPIMFARDGTNVVIGGGEMNLAYSLDGINWTAVTTPFSAPAAASGYPDIAINAVAFGNGVFVVAAKRSNFVTGSLNQLATSVDGINWTTRADTTWPIAQLAFGNGVFVAFSDISFADHRIGISTDGYTWDWSNALPDDIYNELAGSITFGRLAFGNGEFYLSKTGRVWASPDGINWAFTGSVLPNQTQVMVNGNGRWISGHPAVGGSGGQGLYSREDSAAPLTIDSPPSAAIQALDDLLVHFPLNRLGYVKDFGSRDMGVLFGAISGYTLGASVAPAGDEQSSVFDSTDVIRRLGKSPLDGVVNEFSLGAWVYRTSNVTGTIMRQGNVGSTAAGFSFVVNSTGSMTVVANGINRTSTQLVLPLNTPHLIGVSVTATTVTFYIDGLPAGTGPRTASGSFTGTLDWQMARDMTGGGPGANEFIGQIADEFVCLGALTQAEWCGLATAGGLVVALTSP